MNEEKLSIILDACSNYLVNAQGARGHRFESYSSRHNGKIAQWQSTYITKNASSFMAGWCNGSTPGSLPGDSVRVGTRSHIAEWTSQFKSSGPLPEERRSVADLCSQGLFAPSKYANRARGWIVCSFRKLPLALWKPKALGYVAQSFESAIQGKRK